jgi:hypothetical protein
VDDGSSVPVAFSEDDGASTTAAHPRPPRRILDRSASIVQREDELARRALVVAVLSGSSDFILTSIANRFEIEVSSLSLQRLGDVKFLLILPTEERGIYIFAIITNGKHSKAILRIAPTYLPLLFANTFNFALFADVAAQHVHFC